MTTDINTTLNNKNSGQHFESLLEEYGFNRSDTAQKLNKKNFAAQLSLSAVGGLMYWFSSAAASDRYLSYANHHRYLHWMSFIFLYRIPELSAAVTNSLFNAESYLTLYENFFAKRSEAERNLTDIEHERTAWFMAFMAGIGATLPNWYVSFAGATSSVAAVSTISAICSLPVNIDGSKTMTDILRSFDVSSRARVFCCENPQQQDEFEKLRKTQLKLVAHLEKQAQLIRRQQVAIPAPAADQSVLDTLAQILALQPISTEETALIAHANSSPSKLLQPLVVLIWIVGIYQNYGGVYDSYLAGNQIHWSIAGIAALANAMPSLGYTAKGLNGVVFPLIYGTRQKSIAELELPKTNLALTLTVCIFAAFSCFTSDQMGYDAWNWWPNRGGETGAFISGLVSNLGSAFLYNLPQCILFVPRILDLYLSQCSKDEALRHAMSLGAKVDHLARTIKQMPVRKFGKLLESDGMRDILVPAHGFEPRTA